MSLQLSDHHNNNKQGTLVAKTPFSIEHILCQNNLNNNNNNNNNCDIKNSSERTEKFDIKSSVTSATALLNGKIDENDKSNKEFLQRQRRRQVDY